MENDKNIIEQIDAEPKLVQSNIGKTAFILGLISLICPFITILTTISLNLTSAIEIKDEVIVNLPKILSTIIAIILLLILLAGIVLPIISFIFAKKAKGTTSCKYRKAAIILSIFGLVFTIFTIIAYIILILIVIVLIYAIIESLQNIGK